MCILSILSFFGICIALGFLAFVVYVMFFETNRYDYMYDYYVQPFAYTCSSQFAKTHDDLKLIEGIGPKISELLVANKVDSFYKLSIQSEEQLKAIMYSGGKQFIMHDVSTWAYQAGLAHNKKWAELKDYQKVLGQRCCGK